MIYKVKRVHKTQDNSIPHLFTEATKWVIENENTALKAIYGKEILRQTNMKIQTCFI